MKKLISLFLVLVCSTMIAQRDMNSVVSRVSDFSTSLENRAIDTYFISMRYCTGETQVFEMPNGRRCFSQGTYVAAYVVWQEEGETKVKKIDNCGMFASVPLEDNTLFDFFKKNTKTLHKDTVKPYEIEGAAGGPMLRAEIKDCHRKYTFVDSSIKSSQVFKPFDLTNDAREQNKNYEYNQALAITNLEKLMDTIITFVEANPAHIRIN